MNAGADAMTKNVEYQMIAIETIRPSDTNPRKKFDVHALGELSASIAQYGVLQPILVRPLRAGYEIVCGERRFRAARDAGLTLIPATVRCLSDAEVLEIQVIENLNREDLDPIEEASGFRLLHERSHLGAAEIAARIKKSPSYVYARMRLTELPSAAQDAVKAGTITAHAALLLASISAADMQTRALDDIVAKCAAGQPASIDVARRIVRQYQTDLTSAQWDLADASLVPSAGACEGCPRRTAGGDQLFEGMTDVCLDAKCFASKSDAVFERAAAIARATKGKVLSDEIAEQMVYDHSGWNLPQARNDSGLVLLDEICPDDPDHRRWRDLLAEKPVPIQVGRTNLRRVFEAVDERAALAAIQETHRFAKGLKPRNSPQNTSKKSKSSKARPAVQEVANAAAESHRAAEIDAAVRARTIAAIVEKVRESTLATVSDGSYVDFALRLAVHLQAESVVPFALVHRRWGKKSKDPIAEVKKRLASMKFCDVVGVLLELSMNLDQDVHFVASAMSISVDEIEASVDAEFAAKDRAKAEVTASGRRRKAPKTAADATGRAAEERETSSEEEGS